MFGLTGISGMIMDVLLYWTAILGGVAAYPIVAAVVFVVIVTGMIMLTWHAGWIWGVVALTVFGLALGPALVLTPVILGIKGLAALSSNHRSPPAETTVAPRPILLEPRVADQNR
jgi:hypothetical protein